MYVYQLLVTDETYIKTRAFLKIFNKNKELLLRRLKPKLHQFPLLRTLEPKVVMNP